MTEAPSEPSYQRLREAFDRHKTWPLEYRLQQLNGVKRFCKENTKDILEAVSRDTGKGLYEANILELAPSLFRLEHVLTHLEKWMVPETVRHPVNMQPGISQIHYQPKGVVLAVTPCSLPFNLAMEAVLAPLSAGNCVMLKPSELSSHTVNLLQNRLPLYVDSDCFSIVCEKEGEAPEECIQRLLNAHDWNHVLFIGSSRNGKAIVGNERIVKNLTPLTLQLGGKTPAVVLKSAFFLNADNESQPWQKSGDVATFKRLLGKMLHSKLANNGQMGIGTDYLLVDQVLVGEVISLLKQIMLQWYGLNPKESAHYGRIIGQRNFDRAKTLKQNTRGEVVYLSPQGCDDDREELYLAPCLVLVDEADFDFDTGGSKCNLLSEEVSAPIFPVLTFRHVEEVPGIIRRVDPTPLCLYIFSRTSFSPESTASKHAWALEHQGAGFQSHSIGEMIGEGEVSDHPDKNGYPRKGARTTEALVPKRGQIHISKASENSRALSDVDFIMQNTRSGSVCINDAFIQHINPHLPFGGVGSSGWGRHHGKFGFVEYSMMRSVVKRGASNNVFKGAWESLSERLRYPPYEEFGSEKTNIVKWFYVGPLVPDKISRVLASLGVIGTGLFLRAKM